jgi:hypothetical protein
MPQLEQDCANILLQALPGSLMNVAGALAAASASPDRSGGPLRRRSRRATCVGDIH